MLRLGCEVVSKPQQIDCSFLLANDVILEYVYEAIRVDTWSAAMVSNRNAYSGYLYTY